MPEEMARLVDDLEGARAASAPPLTAFRGRLAGEPVVVAEAGVGKTSAASVATALIERFDPAALVVSGIAGGLGGELAIGDIVVGRTVVDVDYGRLTDAGIVAYQPGQLPLPGVEPRPGYRLPDELAAAVDAALGRLTRSWPVDALGGAPRRIVLGTIATGDVFVASPLRRAELAGTWSADAVEMEGAAVCGVATRYGRPWLVVRTLSDGAGEDSALDMIRFVEVAAARSAHVVETLLPVLAAHARTPTA